ncbi:MAG: FIST N-terminal domain-containing protein [Limisphaerales bacterium]
MTSSGFATALLIADAFDEGTLRARLEAARRRLPGERADLALVFASPPLLPRIREINELIQVHGHARLLAGCSAHGVIGQLEEVEDGAALSILLLSLPGAQLTPVRVSAEDVEESTGPGWWHAKTGIHPDGTRGWLFFADPGGLDAERWLQQWNEAYPGTPCLGGLAGGTTTPGDRCLFLNQDVFTDGGIGVSVGGSVRLEAIVSQGCTPIGRPWTITGADRNFILRIGNVPALTVLQDTFNALPSSEKARANGNIFVGLAVDEYREEHRRGDFLVRNLLGADPNRGIVAVGAQVRVGQTVQFQFRDGAAATEDFSALLAQARRRLAGQKIVASCLCSCAGRGQDLFGRLHHDTRLVHENLGLQLPLAGFFCNGEIGPVGRRNHLHGYTASLALFVADASACAIS